MADVRTQFQEEIRGKLGPVDVLPVPDGGVHRFHVPGDRAGSKNGWYVLHADSADLAYGAFGSWKSGDRHAWSSRQSEAPIDAAIRHQRAEQCRSQREIECSRRQQEAAQFARRLWCQAGHADPHHPYLVSKRCDVHGLRQQGEVLLVPLCYQGQLVNVQRIFLDGTKRFLSGGRVNGCYSPIGAFTKGMPLYICEGWATGATIHETTGAPVAAAMNAGNLLPAGQELSRRYPQMTLIVAGDDDRGTSGNPGRAAATKAADALGIGLVFPAWPEGAPLTLTDFNDLRQWQEGRA